MNARKNNSTRMNLESLENREVPAQLASIQALSFGDGSAQRSMVKQVTVKFAEPTTMNESIAKAITVHRNASSMSAGEAGDVDTIVKSYDKDTSTLTLGFRGSLADGNGSLINGYYDVIVDTNVLGVQGSLGGVDDGEHYTVNGTLYNKMFRLAGDANGDGIVNRTDSAILRSAFGTHMAAFDFNGDGMVDQRDLLSFSEMYGTSP